jgi:hypothetical protein
LSFFKKKKELKVSFLYLFFLKKKISGGALAFDFFFYNNLYYYFFKKIFLLVSTWQNRLVFIADTASNAISGIRDLNFLLFKRNYAFMKLSEWSTDFLFLASFKDHFKFFFINSMPERLLANSVSTLNEGCGLFPIFVKPEVYGFYLPILIDYTFSLFFYKFYFFFLLANLRS